MEYSQTTNMAVLRTTYITYPALLSVIVNGEDLFLKGDHMHGDKTPMANFS